LARLDARTLSADVYVRAGCGVRGGWIRRYIAKKAAASTESACPVDECSRAARARRLPQPREHLLQMVPRGPPVQIRVA